MIGIKLLFQFGLVFAALSELPGEVTCRKTLNTEETVTNNRVEAEILRVQLLTSKKTFDDFIKHLSNIGFVISATLPKRGTVFGVLSGSLPEFKNKVLSFAPAVITKKDEPKPKKNSLRIAAALEQKETLGKTRMLSTFVSDARVVEQIYRDIHWGKIPGAIIHSKKNLAEPTQPDFFSGTVLVIEIPEKEIEKVEACYRIRFSTPSKFTAVIESPEATHVEIRMKLQNFHEIDEVGKKLQKLGFVPELINRNRGQIKGILPTKNLMSFKSFSVLNVQTIYQVNTYILQPIVKIGLVDKVSLQQFLKDHLRSYRSVSISPEKDAIIVQTDSTLLKTTIDILEKLEWGIPIIIEELQKI